jgi:hypothetical protein
MGILLAFLILAAIDLLFSPERGPSFFVWSLLITWLFPGRGGGGEERIKDEKVVGYVQIRAVREEQEQELNQIYRPPPLLLQPPAHRRQ